jgi:quercetin dioxygenase-like cupin family protein
MRSSGLDHMRAIAGGGSPSRFNPREREGRSPMDLQIRRFDQPDERRTFEKGAFQVVTAGGMTLGRASYEPGWKWSEHVGPTVGTDLCGVEHVGIVISGRAAVRMADGTELVMEAGDVFAIPPGHDSWVVGEEPYVSLHLLGATNYAAGPDEA